MKTFLYSYESKASFSRPVTAHSFLLRAVPYDDDVQTLVESSVEISSGPCLLSTSTDVWGSELVYGHIAEAHAEFSYVSKGKIVVSGGRRKEERPSPVFSLPSSLASYEPSMAPLLRDESAKSAAMEMALAVKERISYVPGSTGNATTAMQAYSQSCGVCQDFSHILIALCRHIGIPARYVCGFYEGEGETHAWVEIWSDGEWVGIDPTAGRLCDDRYIALGRGRDAADCPVNRGLFTGIVTQSTQTVVKVKQINEDGKDNI
ncbi:MAG: transglutaminase family protein [Bacteroidales bacterium]|nr:transglutaminase family protein [Bacteroidales bacterium]